jgi:hypothetical protein
LANKRLVGREASHGTNTQKKIIMLSWFTENWHVIIAAVVGIYEVIARIIPTVTDITIIGKIIALLKWLTDNLNNFKK